jgi:hypothetical protein
VVAMLRHGGDEDAGRSLRGDGDAAEQCSIDLPIKDVVPDRPVDQRWATDPRTVTRPCIPPYLQRAISVYYSHEMAIYFLEAVLHRVAAEHRCPRLCTKCRARRCVLRRHHPAPSEGQHVCIPCLGETAVVMQGWARDREEDWGRYLRENFDAEPF